MHRLMLLKKRGIDAGIDPTTVSFIETHGTATKLGDPIEIEGITKAFKRYTDNKKICAIGAVYKLILVIWIQPPVWQGYLKPYYV